MAQTQKYQQCMVMAGGGFRFGIYLGIYAAACDAGQAPDFVLASCGSAMAAALIHSVPDLAEQKRWLASPQMYGFFQAIRSEPQASLYTSMRGVAARRLSTRPAPVIPDLFNEYLFTLPAALPPFASHSAAKGPDIGIVGSKLLYTSAEVGQVRGTRKLFEETVFCGSEAAQLLHGTPSPFADAMWGNTAVADTVACDTLMPLEAAVRISVSDMYYFACHAHGGANYMGGVVDLFPIELAHRLADSVVMEFKSEFDQGLSVPAWRTVLGIDANKRLRHAHAQHANVWIDTSDILEALPEACMRKEVAWRQNHIRLIAPSSHTEFARHMNDQWNFGYQRGREAFARSNPSSQVGMRNANRYNRAL